MSPIKGKGYLLEQYEMLTKEKEMSKSQGLGRAGPRRTLGI